jgi:2-oxo-4-hydroxy-4-carboxy-5-ureidoimidazoline decarboxylase
MNLTALNDLCSDELQRQFLTCCGSSKWSQLMVHAAPFPSEEALFEAADKSWAACVEEDWQEAFRHHPRIGDLDSLRKKFTDTRHLAKNEQAAVNHASEQTLRALKSANDAYEQRFAFIFIVFATGKSAGEMLGLLEQRMLNDRTTELHTAAAEQHKITLLRLKKLLQ